MLAKSLVEKYKSLKKKDYLSRLGKYNYAYAFAGVGQHSIVNLYPCLQSLSVPLKFIYSRNYSNAEKLAQQFRHCQATADYNDLLKNPEIKGIFICSDPSTHFELLRKALEAGKAVFIEKPPCQSFLELKQIINSHSKSICLVALQRRFSAVNRMIYRHRLIENTNSYVYRYCSGSYPEGNPVTELFIHAIDNAIQLFGEVKTLHVQSSDQNNPIYFHLIIKHKNNVHGMIELSTGYSWGSAFEKLEINTKNHLVFANYPNILKTMEKPHDIFGIPAEKVIRRPVTEKIYLDNNGFIPGASQNSLVVQGFYPEVKHFLARTESGTNDKWTDISSLYNVYTILDQLRIPGENKQ